MSFLKFATDEVRAMAGKLETSGGQMKGASQKMKHADTKQIGHEGLESACDEFANSWDYGFGTSAVGEARIGGDLYEVVSAPGSGLRVIVGDVQGKGLEAVETAAKVLGAFHEAAHDEPGLMRTSLA